MSTTTTTTQPGPADRAGDVDVDVTDIEAAGAPRPPRPTGSAQLALVVALPIVVLVAIVLAVAASGDRILAGFGHNPPSADELIVERTTFHRSPDRIELQVVNPQAEPISIGQVLVDGAFVNDARVEGGASTLDAKDARTVVIPYRWVRDDPYVFGLISSSGVTTESEVAAAVPAPEVTGGGLGWGALIGLLVGVVPVGLGLAWLPALRRVSPAALSGFLALTAGLLVFLAVDAIAEAMETQAGLVPAFGGAGVVVTGVVVSMVALALTGRLLQRAAVGARRTAGVADAAVLGGGTLALLIAIGIGLHNLGEGLAIGSGFASGEAALAIGLVIGFMVHNITEGIGIAAPLARDGRPLGVARGLGLALAAGLPAVLGIWLGRYVGGPLFTTFCFALAAGAALQVVVEVVRVLRRGEGGLTSTPVQAGFAAGLLVMWSTGILAG